MGGWEAWSVRQWWGGGGGLGEYAEKVQVGGGEMGNLRGAVLVGR